MTNTWTTARGAKITLATEHITTEELNLDGHKTTVKTDRIDIIEVAINNDKQTANLTTHQGQKVLHCGYKKINGKQHPFMIAIPADVYQAVWGEYDNRMDAKFKAEMDAERKYQEHHNAVKKMMAE